MSETIKAGGQRPAETARLTENEARAFYALRGRGFDNYGPGFTAFRDVKGWGMDRLEWENVRRQVPSLARKGLARLTDSLPGGGFHLTRGVEDAWSRWYAGGGSEKVEGW